MNPEKNRKLAIATIAIMCFSIMNLIGMLTGYLRTDRDRGRGTGIDYGGNIVNADNQPGDPTILNLFYKYKLYSKFMLVITAVCAAVCGIMLWILYSSPVYKDSEVTKSSHKNYILTSAIFASLSCLVLVILYYKNHRSNDNAADAISILWKGVVATFVFQVISLILLFVANLL